MGIKIVTDSASDLPKDWAEKSGIEVLPILVYIDGVEYEDGVSLSAEALYEAMIDGKEVKTAQIPLKYFLNRFEAYANSQDHYVYLAFSSKLSGTYQTAMMAYDTIRESYPNFEMTIIDTKCVSLGLGVIAVEAAKRVKNGATLSEILAYVNWVTPRMAHVFSVDDLEYLYRGGRVSRSKAIIGNLLNIKPILKVDDGALIPFDKAKGRKKRLQMMLDYVEAHGVDLGNQLIGIAHTLNEEEALYVKSEFEKRYGTKDFVLGSLGCAVGAHCGPGLITLFFMTEQIPNEI